MVSGRRSMDKWTKLYDYSWNKTVGNVINGITINSICPMQGPHKEEESVSTVVPGTQKLGSYDPYCSQNIFCRYFVLI